MTQQPRRYGWLTRLAAISGAMLLALTSAQSATAADSRSVDDARLGSISVHKFVQPDAIGPEGDGTEQDTTGLTPIAGIGFTARLIDRAEIDLSTNEGWRKVAALNGDVAAAEALGFDAKQPVPDEVITDGDGLALFEYLDVGLYLITESDSQGYTPAAPFLVTVPLTNPDNNSEWMYDIHVYPKNSRGNDKTVQDSGAIKVGDELNWTILGDIPRGGPLSGYQVADTLDERLEYVPTAGVSLTNAGSISLDAADYTIDYIDSPQHPKYLAGKYEVNTVLITFTASGLLKIEEAGKASGVSQVKIDITTRVVSMGDDGVIDNDASIYPDEPSIDWKPGDPDPENPGVVVPPVSTKWGNINFQKVDDKGNALEGAQFQVYLTEGDARDGVNPISISRDAAGNEINPPQDTFVSDANGEVKITGLRYSKWSNGVEVKPGDSGYRSYWIAETKSPDGFSLLAEPIEVEVVGMDNAVVVGGGDLEEIVNVPSNGGFQLPNTGGTGTALLGVASVLLALGAIAMLMRRSKRKTSRG